MDIKVNERAVHATHGLGRVSKLEIRRFPAGPTRLYYNFEIPTGTVWVPVEGSTGGLRHLTAKADLDRYRNLLSSCPTPLAADHRQRQLALKERQKDNSFDAKCMLVRDLAALGWHKELNESSGAALRSARTAVCEEWAAVEGLSLAEATQEVMTLLADGKRTYLE
jgi:RNA polymerase-interacting CarD/CdnL/TRCF family regulator